MEERVKRLYAALRWLVDDMTDAGEAKNPQTGEEYDSVANARGVLEEIENDLGKYS